MCNAFEGHNFPFVEGFLRKGQVVFLHSNVVHGSETNDSDRFRKNFYVDILNGVQTLQVVDI